MQINLFTFQSGPTVPGARGVTAPKSIFDKLNIVFLLAPLLPLLREMKELVETAVSDSESAAIKEQWEDLKKIGGVAEFMRDIPAFFRALASALSEEELEELESIWLQLADAIEPLEGMI